MNAAGGHVEKLREYFLERPAVLLAFLFGSSSSGRTTNESDVDVAVYLSDAKQDEQIWRELTSLLQREVDLVRLDQAPATLVSAVLKQARPLVIRDRRLYWRLVLEQTLEAEDFLEFARSYRAVARRSASLSPEDEARLLERMQFLDGELGEIEYFRTITLEQYRGDKARRRNLERWAENIINAVIDIAKIVLASEGRPMPRTYQDALESFALLVAMDVNAARKFSSFARLRNLLAHEYLEILYEKISDFIRDFLPLCDCVSSFVQAYVETARGAADSKGEDTP